MVSGPDLVPLGVAGAALVAAGVTLWSRRLTVPAANALGLLLVLRGALNLSATWWFFDPDSALATRLWPALDVLVAATAFNYAYRAHHRGLKAGALRGNGLISSVRLLGGLTAGLVFFAPELYWGGPATDGPLFALNGLKFVAYAAIALVFIGPAVDLPGGKGKARSYLDRTDAGRHGLFLVGAAWCLDVLYWNAVDGLVIEAMGSRLPDVRAGFDHYGRLLAIPLGAWLVARLIGQGRLSLVPDRRGFAKTVLLLGAIAIAIPVVFFDLHAFGVIGEAATNQGLVLWWDAWFTLPVALVVFHPWLRPERRPVGAGEAEGQEPSRVLAGLRFGDGP